MRLTFVLIWLCAAVTAAIAQGAGETRVALVIGNGAYASVGSLDNPTRDASAVAQGLREAGFQSVQVENDLGHDALLKALRRFEETADTADWALVYYAGHGIEVGGVNYLIPVDARIRSDRDVEEEAVSLPQVQKRLEGARKLRLVILDACRDNPFLAKMRRTQSASRSVGRGLAVPDLPQSGSLVAYSAAAGQVALDGQASSGNSPYAAALVKNLAVPDAEVNLFFRRVRVEVLRATANRQEPATYESLPDDRFVVRPAPPAAMPVPSPSAPPAPGPTAALTPAVPAPAVARSRRALVEACDRSAASLKDPDRPAGVAGVAFAAIASEAAVSACRAAGSAWGVLSDEVSAGRAVAASVGPDDLEVRRVLYQLGRALDAGGRYGEAKARYEQAAALGSAAAMTNLGALYANGQGTARDYGAARGWYVKAIAAGDATATFNLGDLYAKAQGVARDYGAAWGLYKKAADAGDADAMYKLGVLYAGGLGVARDYGAARVWFERAAAGGNLDARRILAELGRGHR